MEIENHFLSLPTGNRYNCPNLLKECNTTEKRPVGTSGVSKTGFLTFILLQNIKNGKGGLFGDKKKFRKKSHSAEKNRKAGPFSLVRFCGGKSSCLKQGLEPPTAGFPLNLLKSVLKSGTYRVSSVL